MSDTMTLALEVIVLVVALAAFVSVFYWLRWLSENAKNQTIRKYADEAYSWAEAHGRELVGSERAKIAYQFLADIAKKKGLKITDKQIQAQVQLAWTRWEGLAKASAPRISNVQEVKASDPNTVKVE